MREEVYRTPNTYRKSARVLTITGQGISCQVRRGMLRVEDGFPLEGPSEARSITRATERVDRVLLLASSGFVTLSALDWTAENRAPVVAVDQSGFLRWTLLPGKGGEWWTRLRRAQALASFTETGLEIARWLITRKLTGQRNVLKELGRPPEAVETSLREVEHARTVPYLRIAEARAADAYWQAWKGIPVHFAPPSYACKVPQHWTEFRGRGSPLSNGARNAADPINVLENYAYALLEAEARIACHEAGLDPYLGILHTDQEARRSMVYDLIEPVRPIADRFVLSLLMNHAFRPGELWALRDGRCRLDQDLCARLWPWMPEFRKALGPVMTFLLSRLRQAPRYTEHAALHLVETAPEVRTHAPVGQKRWARKAGLSPLRSASVCRSCGVLLEGQEDRLYCDDCLPARRKKVNAAILRAGTETLRRLRQSGNDPAHGGAAATARKERLEQVRDEVREWECSHERPDPATFTREILPNLRHVTIRAMARATRLGTGYCSMIRRGTYVPHPRHWEALRALIHAHRR